MKNKATILLSLMNKMKVMKNKAIIIKIMK